MKQAALKRLLNPGEQNMASFGTSTRRRRNSWWGRVQMRRQRAPIDRERSVREMNQQVERETRHNAASTPTWLLREGQLRGSDTQAPAGVPNYRIETNRALIEGRNIPAMCPYGDRDASPGRPILYNFMTLPHDCLGKAESEIDQPRDGNPRIREGENDYGLDLTLRLKPSSEADTSIQLPARNTNSSTLKVGRLAHLQDDHHTD